MHAIAGTKYIQIGGDERPLRFGTNQTGKFCEMYKMEPSEYFAMLANPEKMSNLVIFRDLLFSALFAGARTEKLAVDFSNEDVGDWFDDIEDKEAFVKEFAEAMQGVANPNGNRAQRRAKEKAKS